MKVETKAGGGISSAELWAAGAILVCLFGQIDAIGLTGPDEPRYVWIARAMAQTGDWVTPKLYGQPWFEKPILYYWAAAIGFRLHFAAEWAARLPSALSALAVALAIGWLARRIYGRADDWVRDPATVTAVLFATTVAAIGFARAATPDMMFSGAIALAMCCAAVLLADAGAIRAARTQQPSVTTAVALGTLGQSRRRAALALFGALLALGVLAKGPAAVILAGGALLLWALCAGGKWREVLKLAHPIAIVAFCVVALPWYVLCAARNPDFLRVFILQHNFERYLTPIFQHRQPFWFFGPIMLLALLPWTALLWPTAQQGLRLWREKSWHASPGFFFACWAVFPVLFFSFSASKLPSYVLPAIPPLALVCGRAWLRTVENKRSLAQVGIALALTWIALAAAAIVFVHRIPWQETLFGEDGAVPAPHAAYAGLALLIPAAVVMAVSALRGNARWIATLCVICFVGSLELANIVLLPQLDGRLSARPYAQFLRNAPHADRIFTYQLPRAWDYGLAFYFERELPEWSPSDPDPAFVLATPQGLESIRKLGRTTAVLSEMPANQALVYVPVSIAPHRFQK